MIASESDGNNSDQDNKDINPLKEDSELNEEIIEKFFQESEQK